MAIKTFWTNSIWYISLGIISIAILSLIIIKSKQKKKDLGFFLAVFGMTLIIETIIYVFLRAYEYYPLIITTSPKDDGVLGNIISQFSISTAILFVCFFHISTKGIVLITFLFYIIEKLFLFLEIYKHYWYKEWITSIGLIVLFKLSLIWYRKVFTSSNKLLKYTTVLLGVLSLYLPTTNWIAVLSGYFDIKDNLLIDPYISHALIAIPKYLIMMNIVYFLYDKKAKWFWYIVTFSVIFICDTILYYTNLMYVKDGFLFIYSGICFLTVYLYIVSMRKLLYS